jgi:uncharacterized membrane protein
MTDRPPDDERLRRPHETTAESDLVTRQMDVPRPAEPSVPTPPPPPLAPTPIPPPPPPAAPATPATPAVSSVTQTSVTTGPLAAQGVVRRRSHPFIGLIGGLLLGLGVALLLISYSLAPLGVATPWVTIAIFLVLGLLWGLFGPTRGGGRAEEDVDAVRIVERERRP